MGNLIDEFIEYIRGIMLNIAANSRQLDDSSKIVVANLSGAEVNITDVSATMEEMSAAMEETSASFVTRIAQQSDIFSFSECLPSMNDVFLRVVGNEEIK